MRLKRMTFKPGEARCPTCRGEGRIHTFGSVTFHGNFRMCQTCKGTGKVKDNE